MSIPNHWGILAKQRSIQKKIDLLTDYVILCLPPESPEQFDQFKKIQTARKDLERMKHVNRTKKNTL